MSDLRIVRIENLDKLLRKLDRPSWVAGPAGRFLDRWRFAVEAGGKRNAPSWRGHLRRSITSKRDQSFFPRHAEVGTNNPAAKPMEFGTGLLSDAPDSSHKRHWPPGAALEPWALAHGFGPGGGFVVARAIGLRGGLKPRRFLRDAADDAEGKIGGWLAQMAGDIEAEAGRA